MTERDTAILELAGRFYRRAGAKESAAMAELGLSPTRFWQRVFHLLDDPSALAAQPVLVNRLRRQREIKVR